MQHTEAMSRELSLQALQRAGVEICGNNVTRAVLCRLVTKVESLEKDDRRLVLAEAATRICIHSLEIIDPLYREFEQELWLTFSEMKELESQVESFMNPAERLTYAMSQY